MISQRKGEFPPVAFVVSTQAKNSLRLALMALVSGSDCAPRLRERHAESSQRQVRKPREDSLGRSVNLTIDAVSDRLQSVDKAFANVFGIIVLPVSHHAELQCRLIQTPTRVKVFTGE
jgi:hypothetical protein